MAGGIILTVPSSGGDSGNSQSTQVEVLPLETAIVDSGIFNDCPSIKWIVTIHNITAATTRTMEVHAIHDYAGNVDYNCTSILGSDQPAIVTAISGGSNVIDLQVENTSATDTLNVCAYRVIQ